jgi:hypothetical protein
MQSGHAVTPAEVDLASKLLQLEIEPDWNDTIGKIVRGKAL